VNAELLSAANLVAQRIAGSVVAVQPPPKGPKDRATTKQKFAALQTLGADEVLELVWTANASVSALITPSNGSFAIAEDVAEGVITWAKVRHPRVILAPSTAFGREVAGRVAAELGAGLVGDAISIDVIGDTIVSVKPAFSGALVADITCTSPIHMATIRPGVIARSASQKEIRTADPPIDPAKGRITVRSQRRNDDIETLACADIVVGVGMEQPVPHSMNT